MKLTYLLLFATALGILFTACQKEYNPDSIVPPTTPSSGDSTYLDKVVFIDSIGGVRDTTYIIQYRYDNLRRVTEQIENEIIFGIPDTFLGIKYYYNATDTLPQKSLSLYQITPNGLKDSSYKYYKYDQLSRLAFDSLFYIARNVSGSVTESGYTTQTYQYNNNNIFGVTTHVNIMPFSFISYNRDTAITDGNGNILSSSKSNGVNSIFTYDNKPNPYARLSNFRTVNIFPFGETFGWEMQSRNNRLKAYENVGGGNIFDDDLTGKFIYRKDGYPLRIVTNDAPGEYYIVSFIYKKF